MMEMILLTIYCHWYTDNIYVGTSSYSLLQNISICNLQYIILYSVRVCYFRYIVVYSKVLGKVKLKTTKTTYSV